MLASMVCCLLCSRTCQTPSVLYLVVFLADVAAAALPACSTGRKCQCVSSCHIPHGTVSRLPWYQRQAIGSLSVVSAETPGLFDCWSLCPDQGAVNQVVERSMALNSA